MLQTLPMTTLRREAKAQIDLSIRERVQPRAPKSGIGIVLPTGARSRRIFVDGSGKLTAAGKYY